MRICCTQMHGRMTCIAQRYPKSNVQVFTSGRQRLCRARYIISSANSQPQRPDKDRPVNDGRKTPAKPAGDIKAPPVRPQVHSGSASDSSKENKDRNHSDKKGTDGKREVRRLSSPEASVVRQSTDSHKHTLDEGWGADDQEKDRLGACLSASALADISPSCIFTTLKHSLRMLSLLNAANPIPLSLQEHLCSALSL